MQASDCSQLEQLGVFVAAADAAQSARTVGRRFSGSHCNPFLPSTTPQGEEQKKLDVISNDIFSMCLRNCGRTGVIASEEEEQPIAVEETTSGNYIVVFDPLDGSSNIDAGG